MEWLPVNFKYELDPLQHEKGFTFSWPGEMHFPTAKDVYFRAKQTELIMQYQSARTFLGLSQTEEWCYNKPIKEAEDPKFLEILYIDYMSKLMEVALLYYNMVVDLSWVMVYVSVESFIYPQKDLPPICIDNIMPIEDSFKTLREAEKFSIAPSKVTNPIHYIRKVAPQFNEVIQLVEAFWNRFSACNIRNLYNYIKHRGLPLTWLQFIKRLKDTGMPIKEIQKYAQLRAKGDSRDSFRHHNSCTPDG